MTVKEIFDALGFTQEKATKADERPIPKFPTKYAKPTYGDADRFCDMGRRCIDGRKQVKQGLKLLKQSADLGHYLATHLMSVYLEKGELLKKDIPLAIEYARKSADMDFYIGQTHLGELLRNEGQFEEAAKWFRIAAENGGGDAAMYLARLYEKGQGVPQDYTEAIFWYKVAQNSSTLSYKDDVRRALNALSGADGYLDLVAKVPVNDALGVDYLYKHGCTWVLNHEPQQLAFLIHAAALGDPWSFIKLGREVFSSIEGDKYRIYNEDLAAKCLREGMALLEKVKGEYEGNAMEELSEMYCNGVKAFTGNVLIEPDAEKGKHFLMEGVRLGNRYSQRRYGLQLREEGQLAEALKYLILAADQGEPIAAYFAGVMLENGEGCAPDITAAKKYYERSAQNKTHLYSQAALAAFQNAGRPAPKPSRKPKWWPF